MLKDHAKIPSVLANQRILVASQKLLLTISIISESVNGNGSTPTTNEPSVIKGMIRIN